MANEKKIVLTLVGTINCDDNQDEVIQFVEALKSGVLKPHQVCNLELVSIEVRNTDYETN